MLESLILDRSDPKSANYGLWLSKKEIDKVVSSDVKYFNIINNWIHNTVSPCHCNFTSDSMFCKTYVSNINILFNTEILEYKNVKTNTNFIFFHFIL